ncbi:hypothetical protein RHGRI_016494 [Rhododendron griersonianum]|uniref:Phosphoglycerate mutase-like protein 1 n=1 Tax=Rhododendron griersonianum TaxID=479676 RepID=A0AAV6JUE4_9ERIC|nr:hypothetical protein RHGRI_016494 [Rhododendron griersonianum]
MNQHHYSPVPPSMEKIKTKGNLKLFLCCSSIELKGKKKKKNNTEESSPDNEHEEIFAAVFGEKSKRSFACICCSSVEAGSTKSSPPSPRNGPTNPSPPSPRNEIFNNFLPLQIYLRRRATWSRGDGANKVAVKQESIFLLLVIYVVVRHAQGIHNVEGEKDHDAYLSEELFDAHVTPLGWKQVANLKNHVEACGLSKKIELVIVSPLLSNHNIGSGYHWLHCRTMQTAVGVFGGEAYVDGIDAPPLMVANAGKSSHPAISSLNCSPFIAVELCREHLGIHPCDRRRSISEYKPIFPAIDFSLIESDADILWKPDTREKDEELARRGMKFLDWLWTRPEKEIAVVTHSGFLIQALSAFGNDCHPSIKSEIRKPFNNCELRSVVIVDRGMIGSDSSTTNYPGKIPSGPDLPSDVAKEKHPGI